MLTNLAIHPSLPAADLGRAKAWYAEKLGFTPAWEEDGMLLYRSGPSIFTVYETPSAGTAKNTAAVWQVEDLDREMKELRARGVVFEDYDMEEFKTTAGVLVYDDGSKTAWFLDSEGNTLNLTQLPAGWTL
jgi:catechol 2,3-dioxygenase-like lactoylglutathione lyase family enzyme